MISASILRGANRSENIVMEALIRNEIRELKDEIIQIRREFHKYPELGFKEKRTSAKIADYLRNLGLEVQVGIASTGVVALLPGSARGRTLLVRADMDALPIQEKNEVPYKSREDGVMHACGHDGHMAIALITAKILSRHQELFSGQVKFVFQPGEEGFAGAREMINAGVLAEPKVDAAIGLHLAHFFPTGTIAVKSGPVMASMDSFIIKIIGQAGHAAMPNEGVDAILISAYLINALQSLISKEVSPLSPLVVHVGKIHGGNAFNIIADHVELEGTVRTLDEGLQTSIPKHMDRIIKGVVDGLRGTYELDYNFGYPPLINDSSMADLIRQIAKQITDNDKVIDAQPMMVSDDMAFFLREVPGCYYFVGCSDHSGGIVQPAHSPHFDFDEDAMITGAEVMVKAALEYLKSV